MIQSILKTDSKNSSYFLIRATLAVVIFPHGAQKLFGAFGGFGFENSMKYFTENQGLPWIIGFMVILAETFGPLSLLLGFLSRFTAASLALVMIGAANANLQNGFFMNWFGNQPGEGIEFFLLAVAMALQITLVGGGRWSVDGSLYQSMNRKLERESFEPKFETYL